MKHAVVLGGSMAGMLAARTLADHFEQVTIIERDEFPAQPAGRDGVPQARHIHILLLRGKQILEQLFPGIMAELSAAGVPMLNWTAEALTLSKLGWLPRFSSDLLIHTCSRDLLEWTVRQRLLIQPKVQFVENTHAVGLLTSEGNSRVSGVKLRQRGNVEFALDADFVVDASGRSSKMSEWLAQMGYAAPRETVINSFQGYATRWYQPLPDFQADWKALIVGTRPPDASRGGGIYPVENGQWIVTLGGVNKDFPPTDESGFLDFARTLRTPLLYQALQHATPISPVYGFQRTENRLRHYERLTAMPEGLVALGDAVCAFNPVYGQGMTVAAMGALVLDELLRHPRATNFSLRFQQALAKSNETAWLMATGEDFRWPLTEGQRPRTNAVTAFVHAYMNILTALITEDPYALSVFYQVAHLVQSPTAFFQPKIAASILRKRLTELTMRSVPNDHIGLPPTWSEAPEKVALR
ncbi:MAG: FAD-dependent monooxygenase [Chloroflexi bacterium]|nr:FAD-dependent monooxygenase [Chloroflexota bacterium]